MRNILFPVIKGLWPVAFGVLVAAGCAYSPQKNETSPYYPPPVDSLLIINDPIRIPPGRTRVFMQNGEVKLKIDHYIPNCNIEIRKLDTTQAQEVRPGEYIITEVQRTLEEVVKARPVMIASLSMLFAGEDNNGTSMVYDGYHFWLKGSDSNVMRLSCRGVYADPHRAFPPSRSEIRQSLGKIAQLKIK